MLCSEIRTNLISGTPYLVPRHLDKRGFTVACFIIPCAAFLIEMIHHLVGRTIYNFQPLLTRAEVNNNYVGEYFADPAYWVNKMIRI